MAVLVHVFLTPVQVGVSDLLHAPAASPLEKEPLVHIRQEVGWTPELVWMIHRSENSWSSMQTVAILTTLIRNIANHQQTTTDNSISNYAVAGCLWRQETVNVFPPQSTCDSRAFHSSLITVLSGLAHEEAFLLWTSSGYLVPGSLKYPDILNNLFCRHMAQNYVVLF